MELCDLKGEAKKKVHAIIDKYADRGLRALGVASQVWTGFLLSFSLPFQWKTVHIIFDSKSIICAVNILNLDALDPKISGDHPVV